MYDIQENQFLNTVEKFDHPLVFGSYISYVTRSWWDGREAKCYGVFTSWGWEGLGQRYIMHSYYYLKN